MANFPLQIYDVVMLAVLVLATLFGLWGLVVYVVLWVILPLEPLALPPARAAPPERAPGST